MKSARCVLVIVFCWAQAQVAGAHGMAFTTPISQPSSPVQLKDCYLGTDFMFGDPKLKSEETKLQLSADLHKAAPPQFQEIGLRFEFGQLTRKHSADIVVFTGVNERTHDVMYAPVGLDPSGYLPRVPGYEDSRCGVDFVTSLNRQTAWFDSVSDVVSCPEKRVPIPQNTDVRLTALELLPKRTDAVFVLMNNQKKVYWRLDTGPVQSGEDDGFGRVVAALSTGPHVTYSLRYGGSASALDQQVCFRPLRP